MNWRYKSWFWRFFSPWHHIHKQNLTPLKFYNLIRKHNQPSNLNVLTIDSSNTQTLCCSLLSKRLMKKTLKDNAPLKLSVWRVERKDEKNWRKHSTHSSSESVKRTRFATAAGGGLCGKSTGLNSGKNRWANLLISFGTSATDCFLVLSTMEAANVFLVGCWPVEDVTLLAARGTFPVITSFASPNNRECGR